MTLSATYADDIGRVRVVFSGYSADADYATVERSTDGGITYVPVRGGSIVPVTAGAGSLDDFDFTPGILNTYRVSAIDSAAQQWIGSGGPVTGNNATVTPACSGSTLIGDLVLLYATIRNSGAGVPNTPAGWTLLVDMGNARLFGRYATANGSVGQAVTFTGGVANADTTGQMTTLRNTSMIMAGTPSIQTNASAQNIAYPASTPSRAGVYAVVMGWKQDDWTSAPTISGWDAEAGQVAATAGDDAGHVWWVRAKGSLSQQPAGSWTVTGGAAAISKAAMAFFPPRPFTDQETTTITPSLVTSLMPDQAWLKNPSRPGLNTKVTITEISEITRKSRTGRFDVLGRTLPVAITDVQSSREFTLEILVNGNAEALDMDNRLSTGEPMFLQPRTLTDDIPTLYFVAGDVTRTRLAKASTAITFTIPLIEVAAPGSTVAGATYTWADVIANYASWTAAMAANPSWSNLIDKVSNSVVIVP